MNIPDSKNKHWSKVEKLAQTVRNPNIHVKGFHSYYSDAWTGSFEESVVRYHYGDEYSLNAWAPAWPIDQLYIGDYVCIGAEAVILMGGNHTHRTDWFSLYPFPEKVLQAYKGKGDTIIEDGVWIGMRAMIMPGVRLGEGAIIASGAVVTKDVPAYTIVAGNPARPVKQRFEASTIEIIKKLNIYNWREDKFDALKEYICDDIIEALVEAAENYDSKLASDGQ
ncbi:CatB-related O-acetyltransferase [Brucella anthropi]|uniref:CatB-related O-acetyltransferase n=1 Tax=Brucella anthropi TaxID=529 RepID=UPI000CFD8593|nr:CatB-related O-acetyltransferase [Ochrobactrum sp. MYb49]PQZ61799.1 antibiotic acetyltransferase [Ochrobactrum sp. MYb49]